MPTGTGKTGIFANITAALKHGETTEEPVRVLVLVPTQTILDQTMGRNGTRGFGKFTPDIDVGAFYQDEKELSHEVVVTTNASFNQLMQREEVPDFDAVIVDEAHMVVGKKTGDNIREYCADKVAIGLSATPEFDEERSAYKLFEHTIHQMGLQEAVKGGLLAPVRAYLKQVNVSVDRWSLPNDKNDRKIALRNANLEARKRAATKIIKQELERGVGVIVRCPAGDDIDHAKSFARDLRTTLVKSEGLMGLRWVDAGFVGGKRQRKRHRHELLDYYDEGRVDVLAYVKAIGMGWDSPHAKVLINLAPTTSRVEMVQAIGRVLRLSRSKDGKPVEARVYDFVDPELGDTQYTPLKALDVASGQLLAHDTDTLPLPKRKRPKRRVRAEVVDVDVKTVGTMVLTNEVSPVFPSEQEVQSSIDRLSPDAKIDKAEACRVLGISTVTYKQILNNLGTNPDTTSITYGDLAAIRELYPGLDAPSLPEEEDYVEIMQLAHQAPQPVLALTLVRYARRQGINPHRFTSPEGKVGFYLKREVGTRLLGEVAENRSRLFS